MKQQLAGKYLWGMAWGCLLYGICFLLLYAQGSSLWGKLASGFMGVGAITLLPVFYGFCLRRLRAATPQADKPVLCSFALVGVFTVFSLPLYCLFTGGEGPFLVGYTLLILLLFHGVLWYQCFIRGGKG